MTDKISGAIIKESKKIANKIKSKVEDKIENFKDAINEIYDKWKIFDKLGGDLPEQIKSKFQPISKGLGDLCKEVSQEFEKLGKASTKLIEKCGKFLENCKLSNTSFGNSEVGKAISKAVGSFFDKAGDFLKVVATGTKEMVGKAAKDLSEVTVNSISKIKQVCKDIGSTGISFGR